MIRRILVSALALTTLAACASDHPRGRGPNGREPGGREGVDGPGLHGGPPRARLFISPSGEPFRGENGFAAWLARAETDHDGAVTLPEFRADALRFFKVLDANGDGVIDGFEMQAYEREIVPEIGVMSFDERPGGGENPRAPGGGERRGGGGRGGRGGGGGMGGNRGGSDSSAPPAATRAPSAGREGAARYSLINEPQPIAAADADLDGKVTLAEWMAVTDRRFARLDHLKTGRLTRDSLLQIQPKKP